EPNRGGEGVGVGDRRGGPPRKHGRRHFEATVRDISCYVKTVRLGTREQRPRRGDTTAGPLLERARPILRPRGRHGLAALARERAERESSIPNARAWCIASPRVRSNDPGDAELHR